MIYIVLVIASLAFFTTYSKYSVPRQNEGKKVSFAGYIQWLKDKYLHANDDEWKD